ncbi:MAG: nuclear transport factor 2 family protein [Pseudomonadota bacterium]
MRLASILLAILTILPNATQAGPAADAAKTFFDRYRAQDVPAMIALFEPGALIEYVPFALEGPVEEVGPGSWGVLIDAFPDLSNDVHNITDSADGRTAFVDVSISGTQAKQAFGVPNKGLTYDLRHLFVIETDADGDIVRLTAFWDNADWYRQLGKTILD